MRCWMHTGYLENSRKRSRSQSCIRLADRLDVTRRTHWQGAFASRIRSLLSNLHFHLYEVALSLLTCICSSLQVHLPGDLLLPSSY